MCVAAKSSVSKIDILNRRRNKSELFVDVDVGVEDDTPGASLPSKGAPDLHPKHSLARRLFPGVLITIVLYCEFLLM